MAIVFDGQVYNNISEIPQMGSIECVGVEGYKRNYQLLSADVGKLPKYDNLATGSSAQCLDTGDYYIYHAPSKTWYLQ